MLKSYKWMGLDLWTHPCYEHRSAVLIITTTTMITKTLQCMKATGHGNNLAVCLQPFDCAAASKNQPKTLHPHQNQNQNHQTLQYLCHFCSEVNRFQWLERENKTRNICRPLFQVIQIPMSNIITLCKSQHSQSGCHIKTVCNLTFCPDNRISSHRSHWTLWSSANRWWVAVTSCFSLTSTITRGSPTF